MFATNTTTPPFVRDVPPYVVKAVREITRDDFRIADRGKPYIATDVVLLPEVRGWPSRQSQVAAHSDKYVLLASRVGGYGQEFRVLASPPFPRCENQKRRPLNFQFAARSRTSI